MSLRIFCVHIPDGVGGPVDGVGGPRRIVAPQTAALSELGDELAVNGKHLQDFSAARSLDSSLNEIMLFHGTSRDLASNIA